MGEPLKVRGEDGQVHLMRRVLDEGGKEVLMPADDLRPAEPAPAAPPQSTWDEFVAQEEAARRGQAADAKDVMLGAAQGASGMWGDELSAKILDALPDPEGYNRAERHGPDTEAAGLEFLRAQNTQAQERSPWLYGAGQALGVAPAAMAASSGIVPVGASNLARGIGIAGGAAEGAAFGGIAGAGAATEGGRVAGAEEGAKLGALGGAAVPGLAGAGRTLVDMGAGALGKMRGAALNVEQRTAPVAVRATLEGAPEDVQRVAVEVAESPTKRAALLRHDRGHETELREITDALTQSERATDAIMTHAKMRLKRGPVVRGMEADGVDADTAMLSAAEVTDDVVQELEQIARSTTGTGTGAMNWLLKGTKRTPSPLDKANMAVGEALEFGGAEGAGDAFMALDQLKRDIGRAVKMSGKGERDPNTEEKLKAAFMHMRDILQDGQTWGNQAATVQREVNAAWVPYISKNQAFQRKFMSDEHGLPGEDTWRTRSEGHPGKVQSVLNQGGTVGGSFDIRTLREGLQSSRDIGHVLAKYYDVPDRIARMSADSKRATETVLSNLDRVLDDNRLAMGMKEAGEEMGEGAGGLLQAVPGVKHLQSAVRGAPGPRMRKLARAEEAGAARTEAAAQRSQPYDRTQRAAYAEGAGVSAATAHAGGAVSASDMVQQLARSNPAALGPHGPDLARAAQEGNFEVVHAIKMQSSQDYQDRLAGLEADHFEEN